MGKALQMPLNLDEIKELLDYPNPPGDEEALEKLVRWTNEIVEEEGLEQFGARPRNSGAVGKW
jgi:hypothetical protein